MSKKKTIKVIHDNHIVSGTIERNEALGWTYIGHTYSDNYQYVYLAFEK